MLGTLYIFTSLVFIATMQSKYYYPHFAEEEIHVDRSCDVPRATDPRRS